MKPWRTIRSGNVELVVEVVGQGAPIIYGHGLTSRRQTTLDQLSCLTKHYQVIAFDQRGHGDSSPITSPALYSADLMVQDFIAIMDSLGIARAIVGGESMGAAVALLFAMQAPERVAALLLTAPAFGGKEPNQGKAQVQEMGRAISNPGMEAYLRYSAENQRTRLGWPLEAVSYVAQMQSAHHPQSLATACQAVMEWRILEDLTPLSALEFPVCIVGWPNDLLHPIKLAQQMKEHFRNADLIEIPPLPELFVRPGLIGQIYGDFLVRMEGAGGRV
ncbi:alpha/beta hydrolase [uncultured Meiothermus sp.]|jgi:pimeloyl-ACP methyl ester carboxylesterase|uniref:alpha/beta fold hydrolase n=1 Tax=uncultured Meiothermus sp. TaxID=157471 RepID=UPI00260888CE|nr:alpha/beta hydrolase [uncultured Meiothermus sp.]